MRRLHRTSIIQRAKREVPLPMVLEMAGVPIEGLPERGVAIKAWCPWTAEHPDPGEKEMRVYAGNDCFCFICQLTMDPVSIAARLWSCSNPEAARRLLDRVADAGRSDGESTAPGSGASPAEVTAAARRTAAVAALARWADRMRVDRFGVPYGRCLEAADSITEDEHVQPWLDACKRFLLDNHR